MVVPQPAKKEELALRSKARAFSHAAAHAMALFKIYSSLQLQEKIILDNQIQPRS